MFWWSVRGTEKICCEVKGSAPSLFNYISFAKRPLHRDFVRKISEVAHPRDQSKLSLHVKSSAEILVASPVAGRLFRSITGANGKFRQRTVRISIFTFCFIVNEGVAFFEKNYMSPVFCLHHWQVSFDIPWFASLSNGICNDELSYSLRRLHCVC